MTSRARFRLLLSLCNLAVSACITVGALFSTATGQQPVSIQVASSSELMSALSSATGGETIFLQPGSYDDLHLHGQKHLFLKFPAPVTIKSVDPQRMALFTSLRVVGVENLTFQFVKFAYKASPGAADWAKPFEISGGSRNIVIAHSVFDGDIALARGDSIDGYGTGYGLYISDASNVTVERNRFSKWARAGVFSSVNNLNLLDNEVSNIRSDGFNFASVNDVRIERKSFFRFRHGCR